MAYCLQTRRLECAFMSLKPKKVDFDVAWPKLLKIVGSVIACNKVDREVWVNSFKEVYFICVATPDPLADRLYAETKSYLEEHVNRLHEKISTGEEGNLLVTYAKYWKQYSEGSCYMHKLYSYLDSQFVKKNKSSDADLTYREVVTDASEALLEIRELAFDIWKRFLIKPLQPFLVSAIMEEVIRDRMQGGSMLSQHVMQDVVSSFVTVEEYCRRSPLALYESAVESPYLELTGSYYRQKSSELLLACGCSEYLRKAIQLLEEESIRSTHFLHVTSREKVTAECQRRLAADHLQVLHASCADMVSREDQRDLANMYTLLKPLRGALNSLGADLEEHIKKSAMESLQTIKGENVCCQFVETMLDVQKKYSKMVQVTFCNDQHFVGVLDRACAAVINFRPDQKHYFRSPDLLAKYCDSLLKKNAKGLTESEIDSKLNDSIIVFKYLDDKDVFQKVYQRMLCKRLVYKQSTSMDAEESMINRLKQTCGYEFTSKLHRMFQDMAVSGDLNNKFSGMLLQEKISLDIGFTTLVLQAGSWPISAPSLPTLLLPQELQRSVQVFEQFYNKRFNGRKLTWIHSYSTGDLKINYLPRPYVVTTGVFQVAILLHFNDAPSDSHRLSVAELKERTQVSPPELQRQVAPLVDAGLLIHIPSTAVTAVTSGQDDEAKDTEFYTLNTGYINKRTKFKVTAALVKDSPQELERTQKTTDDDRKWEIQAAIVRVMKTRKQLKHNSLVDEVINLLQSRFKPSVSTIKKCIETLIDKQYLERSASCREDYLYIA